MELHDALAHISEIRLQMARTEVFRGYRAVPVAFSGLLALAAGALQAVWIPNPTNHLVAYLALWISAAVVSALATGTEMFIRSRRSASPLTAQVTFLAVEQFLPCVAAGGVVTFVLVTCAPDAVWILPGVWAILFALGLYASYRLLPRAIFWVATFYLIAGAFSLALAHGEYALSPWAMAVPFGVGQLLVAAVLYWTLERTDGQA